MKKNALFLFLILLCKLLTAQDTIVKFNGDIIPAKITEITPTEIKYKKITFLDGPTYIENKSEIQYVKYSNGIKEQFATEKPKTAPEVPANTDYYNPNEGPVNRTNKMEPYGVRYKYQGRKIGEREMQKILMTTQDKQIIQLVQSAKDAHGLSFVGFGAIPLGIGALALLITGESYNPNTGTSTINDGNLAGAALCLVGAIACPIVSGVFKHKRKSSNRKAVELYNQKF